MLQTTLIIIYALWMGKILFMEWVLFRFTRICRSKSDWFSRYNIALSTVNPPKHILPKIEWSRHSRSVLWPRLFVEDVVGTKWNRETWMVWISADLKRPLTRFNAEKDFAPLTAIVSKIRRAVQRFGNITSIFVFFIYWSILDDFYILVVFRHSYSSLSSPSIYPSLFLIIIIVHKHFESLTFVIET